MLSVAGNQNKHEWDEESLSSDYASHVSSEDNLQTPLISRQATSMDNIRQDSVTQDDKIENVEPVGIGSGWQLAWKWNEDGDTKGSFKRIFLHEDNATASGRGSVFSIQGGGDATESEYIKAAALVTQPALYTKELMAQHPVGPAMVHPSVAAETGPTWRDLLAPGVLNALIVGCGVQALQQVNILCLTIKVVWL